MKKYTLLLLALVCGLLALAAAPRFARAGLFSSYFSDDKTAPKADAAKSAATKQRPAAMKKQEAEENKDMEKRQAEMKKQMAERQKMQQAEMQKQMAERQKMQQRQMELQREVEEKTAAYRQKLADWAQKELQKEQAEGKFK
ncbi:MAG: hypothetical protein KGL10_09185 [Alphaproteobacteria bacterium]|nr:hypothetical protein [Alphaproteobacteria bacterium]MDE2337472.1 hypothetical protein [Alphaproteobacteria bacterium]